jgi:hypothetical protein
VVLSDKNGKIKIIRSMLLTKLMAPKINPEYEGYLFLINKKTEYPSPVNRNTMP